MLNTCAISFLKLTKKYHKQYPHVGDVTENMLALYVYITRNIPGQSVEWIWQAAGYSFHVSTLSSISRSAFCLLVNTTSHASGIFRLGCQPALGVIALLSKLKKDGLTRWCSPHIDAMFPFKVYYK